MKRHPRKRRELPVKRQGEGSPPRRQAVPGAWRLNIRPVQVTGHSRGLGGLNREETSSQSQEPTRRKGSSSPTGLSHHHARDRDYCHPRALPTSGGSLVTEGKMCRSIRCGAPQRGLFLEPISKTVPPRKKRIVAETRFGDAPECLTSSSTSGLWLVGSNS